MSNSGKSAKGLVVFPEGEVCGDFSESEKTSTGKKLDAREGASLGCVSGWPCKANSACAQGTNGGKGKRTETLPSPAPNKLLGGAVISGLISKGKAMNSSGKL